MKTDFKSIPRKQYIKFGIVALIYLLWVIWLGSYLWLLGLAVIFDLYVTRYVNWTFWKKRNKKNSSLIEWIDALIFALIAVSFINLFLFQNFNIPTSSMEKSLLIGDYLFVSLVHLHNSNELGRWPADAPMKLLYAGGELELDTWLI